MKKAIISFLSFLSAGLMAQAPILNSNVVAPLGSVNTFYKSNNTTVNSFNAGSVGTNVTWNFSALDTTGGKLTQNICKADTCYSFGGFPDANYAIEVVGGYGYALFNNSTYEYFGADASGPIFTNPEKTLAFPFTYNSQFTDVFNDIDSTVYGTMNVKADGYGTLNLPTGTFAGVLRVNAKEAYREYFYDGFGDLEDSMFYEGQYYRWYLPNSANPLLEYGKVVSYLKVGSAKYPVDSNQHLLIFNKKGTTGIHENETVSNVQLYPNPAAQNTTILFEAKSNAPITITILNTLGEKVSTPILKTVTSGKQEIEIPTSALPNGVYFVQLSSSEKTHTQTLLIQH